MFLTRLREKLFDITPSKESITISLGEGYKFTLPVNHAIKLRDAISIQIINTQDAIQMKNISSSRVTNGDMG